MRVVLARCAGWQKFAAAVRTAAVTVPEVAVIALLAGFQYAIAAEWQAHNSGTSGRAGAGTIAVGASTYAGKTDAGRTLKAKGALSTATARPLPALSVHTLLSEWTIEIIGTLSR